VFLQLLCCLFCFIWGGFGLDRFFGRENNGKSRSSGMQSVCDPDLRAVSPLRMGHPVETGKGLCGLSPASCWVFLAEVIGSAYGEEVWPEIAVGEAEPVLKFEVSADVEAWEQLVIDTCADSYQVVGEVGVGHTTLCEVEDSAAVEDLSIGNPFAVGSVVAASYLIGLLRDVGGAVVDVVEFAFDAEVGPEVVVEVAHAAVDAVGQVVGSGVGEAAADLEVGDTGGGGRGLSVKHRCCTQ